MKVKTVYVIIMFMRKRVLIVGSNSFLGRKLNLDSEKFDIETIKRPFEGSDIDLYKSYDVVMNFCLQPKFFFSLLSEDEIIDVNIAKALKENAKFVFMSSRTVYGSNTKLLEYKETDKTSPIDFYSQNKVNVEKILEKRLGSNLLCLRIGNILSSEKSICTNGHCFMSWLYDELMRKKKVSVTIDKLTKRDFMTKTYFNKALETLVLNDASGIYNIGAGFGITIEELLKNILDDEYINYVQQETKSEQFVLNCDKLHQIVEPLKKEELLNECHILRQRIKEEYL